MRNGNLLFSAVQFLLVTALFGVGAVFLGLHYLPHVRQKLSGWILSPREDFLILGGLILSIAFLLSICFWMMHKAHYIRLKMHKDPYSIEETLLKNALSQLWKEEFPTSSLLDIYFASKKIEIIAENVEQDLEQITQRLEKYLTEQIGYKKEFFLTITKN